MRLLALFASLLAIVFYLTRILRFLSGKKAGRERRGAPDTVENRLKRAKKADVIDVKTVVPDERGRD